MIEKYFTECKIDISSFHNQIIEEVSNLDKTNQFIAYTLPPDKITGEVFPWPYHQQWLVLRRENYNWETFAKELPMLNEISQMFKRRYNVETRGRYYKLTSNYELPVHTDRGTQCSFNYVVNGKAPVTFHDNGLDIPIYYKQGICNTTIEHSVPAEPNDRFLLKLSIFEETYNDFRKKVLDVDSKD